MNIPRSGLGRLGNRASADASRRSARWTLLGLGERLQFVVQHMREGRDVALRRLPVVGFFNLGRERSSKALDQGTDCFIFSVCEVP